MELTLSQEFEERLDEFDYDALEKDSVVSTLLLSERSHYPAGSTLLRVWSLELIKRIFKRRTLIARLTNEGVAILNDNDASKYTLDIIATGIRQVRARTRRLRSVNMAALKTQERKSHMYRVIEALAYVDGLRYGQSKAARDKKKFDARVQKEGLKVTIVTAEVELQSHNKLLSEAT